MTRCCPHCGQPIVTFFGVKLTAHQSDIFNMILARADHGVSTDALIGVLYPGKPDYLARRALRANISLLNERLEETDKRVRLQPPRRDGIYRVITVTPRRVIKIRGAA
jgi:hypothetical protein